MSKAKRITDKERLDWIIAGGRLNATFEVDWWVAYDKAGVQHGRRYPRAALDAAIKASRKKGGQ